MFSWNCTKSNTSVILQNAEEGERPEEFYRNRMKTESGQSLLSKAARKKGVWKEYYGTEFMRAMLMDQEIY